MQGGLYELQFSILSVTFQIVRKLKTQINYTVYLGWKADSNIIPSDPQPDVIPSILVQIRPLNVREYQSCDYVMLYGKRKFYSWN